MDVPLKRRLHHKPHKLSHILGLPDGRQSLLGSNLAPLHNSE